MSEPDLWAPAVHDDRQDPDRPQQDDVLSEVLEGGALGAPAASACSDASTDQVGATPPAGAMALPPYLTTTVRPAKRRM